MEKATEETSELTNEPAIENQWSADLPQVRRALRFIKGRGARGVTAGELRDWDAAHGRKLFNWDDPAAADEYRLVQARMFLNRFRGMFDNMRVRAHIFVRGDAEKGIERGAWRTVEVISSDRNMRAQVVADITKRMESLASELAMWKLAASERTELFKRLEAAMSGEPEPAERRAA